MTKDQLANQYYFFEKRREELTNYIKVFDLPIEVERLLRSAVALLHAKQNEVHKQLSDFSKEEG